jgi:hypothetical protein
MSVIKFIVKILLTALGVGFLLAIVAVVALFILSRNNGSHQGPNATSTASIGTATSPRPTPSATKTKAQPKPTATTSRPQPAKTTAAPKPKPKPTAKSSPTWKNIVPSGPGPVALNAACQNHWKDESVTAQRVAGSSNVLSYQIRCFRGDHMLDNAGIHMDTDWCSLGGLGVANDLQFSQDESLEPWDQWTCTA